MPDYYVLLKDIKFGLDKMLLQEVNMLLFFSTFATNHFLFPSSPMIEIFYGKLKSSTGRFLFMSEAIQTYYYCNNLYILIIVRPWYNFTVS